jgi:hypothetical protein
VTRRPGGSDGPEDVDAAFAEIVASLEREGLGAALVEEDERGRAASPTDAAPSGQQADVVDTGKETETETTTGIAKPAGWRTPETEWDPDAEVEEEHFVPPEPPPLPRLRPGTLFGILLMAIGILLLTGPTLIGLAPRIGTPLALVALAGGIGWLVLRMRSGPPPDDWDDGAQL